MTGCDLRPLTQKGMVQLLVGLATCLVLVSAGPATVNAMCPAPYGTCYEGCDMYIYDTWCNVGYGPCDAGEPSRRCKVFELIIVAQDGDECNMMCGWYYDYTCECWWV